MKKTLIVSCMLIFLFSGCKKEKLIYYEKPDWLQGPLFEQIKSTGEYNEFVKAAEATGYDKFLDSRETFTFFLPTDEAFNEYYQELGVNSISDISDEDLLTLLQYHTMRNSWDSTRLIGKTSWSWWSDNALNFRTPCLYTPAIKPGITNLVFNHTFLLLFSSAFMNQANLNASDYETFYPGSTYSGFNINRASIIKYEVGAENGFYYVIDKVLKPKTTADNLISEHPEFSIFMQFLDKFVTYVYDETNSSQNTQYKELYNKKYALNFDLADDLFTDNNPDGYYHVYSTIFVPLNQVILDYFASEFPAYPTINDVPNIIIKYFVEAHLIPNKRLFPSVLAKTENETNDYSDEITFDLNNGIVSEELSSNAIIYGVNSVINSNAFATVSGPIISNPDYTLFTIMLELSGEIRSFFKKEIKHVVFVLPNDIMESMGFTYEEGDPIDFTDDKIFRKDEVGANVELSNDDIKTFLQSYISITYKDIDGVTESYIKTKNDHYLKIKDDTVSGIFGDDSINVYGKSLLAHSYTGSNGVVFEVDQDMTSTTNYTIENYLNDHKADYSGFFELCDNAGFVDSNGDITKLSIFDGVTVMVPNDAAVADVIANYIPPGATSETFDYKKLIKYQIISEKVIFTDDEFPSDMYGTDVFEGGVRVKINVGAGGGVITVTDQLNNIIQISSGPTSNIVTSNGVIQVVDKLALY